MVWRKMKRNHSTAIPRRMIFLDTETHREKRHNSQLEFAHYLRCGHAIYLRLESGRKDRREEIQFDDTRVFWNWLEPFLSNRATLWLIGHKIAFDAAVVGFWNMMDSGDFTIDSPRAKRPVWNDGHIELQPQRGICVLDDPPVIVGLRHKWGGRMILVDSLNWFRQPLSQLGKDVQLPKLEMPADSAPPGEWETYCKRDCEIVEKAFLGLIDFTRENEHGMFRYTAPAQSMALYRHKYLTHDIVFHDEINVKKLERASYYGGEIRQFFVGQTVESVYQLDVNSLYPFVMHGNLFPCKLESWKLDNYVVRQSTIDTPENMVCEVELNTESDSFPFRGEGQTCYPIGEYQTTLCGPELSHAVTTQTVRKVRNFASYSLRELFTDFVTELFSLRKRYKAEGNKSYESLCKLLCNSLYGKFGQKSFKWVHRPDRIAPRKWYRWIERNLVDGTVELFRSIGNDVFYSPTQTEIETSFPAISAWVCSYGRCYMRRLRDIAGPKNVFYQCTDSLAVNKAGYESLLFAGYLSDDRLGGLRLIREGNAAEFRGPNNYTIGTEDVIAGVRRGSVKLNGKQFLNEQFERAEHIVSRDPNATIYSKQSIFECREYEKLLKVHGHGWLEPLRVNGPLSSWQAFDGSNS